MLAEPVWDLEFRESLDCSEGYGANLQAKHYQPPGTLIRCHFIAPYATVPDFEYGRHWAGSPAFARFMTKELGGRCVPRRSEFRAAHVMAHQVYFMGACAVAARPSKTR